VILIDDVYFGDNNEVWFIWMWFDNLFGDDDFLAYTFEMTNCICWVNYAKWGVRWVVLILIDVVKCWILMMI